MREPIIEILQSTGGYIDGVIADISGSSDSPENALAFIKHARRLRTKALHVLEEAVTHAILQGADWDELASAYGLSVQEVKDRYPEAIAEYQRILEERRRYEKDALQF